MVLWLRIMVGVSIIHRKAFKAMKAIVIKKDQLGIEVSDNSVFIQKKKFASEQDWTIRLSVEELKQILKAVEDN